MNNGLVLNEIIDCRDSIQTSKSTLLEASFFSFVVDNRPVVNPHSACIELSSNAQRTVYVLGPDGSAEPIDGVVGKLERFCLAVESLHDKDGSEYLVLSNWNVMVGDLQKGGGDRKRPSIGDRS